MHRDLFLTTPNPIVLVTGPSRSGKSEWAEALAQRSQQRVTYVATAIVDSADLEWAARILQHQQRRPADWVTLAAPVDLTAAFSTTSAEDCLLIDSLGTWLANWLEPDEADWHQEVQKLLTCLRQTQSTVILVAEETGWGVVPAYPVGRTFRDRLGHLTRQVGAIADAVYLVTNGYVLDLQQLGFPLPQS